jgi:hypothetical protein
MAINLDKIKGLIAKGEIKAAQEPQTVSAAPVSAEEIAYRDQKAQMDAAIAARAAERAETSQKAGAGNRINRKWVEELGRGPGQGLQ